MSAKEAQKKKPPGKDKRPWSLLFAPANLYFTGHPCHAGTRQASVFIQQANSYTHKGHGIAVARNRVLPMENDIEPPHFLTLRETAELLRLSGRTVLRMVQRKELPAFKVGGQWRVRTDELAKRIQDFDEL